MVMLCATDTEFLQIRPSYLDNVCNSFVRHLVTDSSSRCWPRTPVSAHVIRLAMQYTIHGVRSLAWIAFVSHMFLKFAEF